MTNKITVRSSASERLSAAWTGFKTGYLSSSSAPIANTIGRLFGIVAICFLVAFPAQFAWNHFLPYFNHDLRRISYMEVWGLIVVLEIVFTRFSAVSDESDD